MRGLAIAVALVHVAPCSDPAALAGTTLMFDAAKHTRHVFSAVDANLTNLLPNVHYL